MIIPIHSFPNIFIFYDDDPKPKLNIKIKNNFLLATNTTLSKNYNIFLNEILGT